MKTTAINQMTAEHRHIETVIKSLQDAVTALGNWQRLNVEKLRNVVEFLRVYADRRHHQREEALFFPILIKRGVPPQGCPIGGLNHEHE
ncbi:MAG: hemerythrin domain-containing protein, partial [Verrucomicrobiota bacterium]|nr:hemerythrin domain-containing protein [Verrucomicrobiota bacterium]